MGGWVGVVVWLAGDPHMLRSQGEDTVMWARAGSVTTSYFASMCELRDSVLRWCSGGTRVPLRPLRHPHARAHVALAGLPSLCRDCALHSPAASNSKHPTPPPTGLVSLVERVREAIPQ